jgi:beta-lactamase class A
MPIRPRLFAFSVTLSLLLSIFPFAVFAHDTSPDPNKTNSLQSILDRAVTETLKEFEAKGLKAENVAASVIDLTDPSKPAFANFRGNERIYPASVIKMLYMIALERWLADGRVTETREMDRALRNMVVDSGNESTQYIVDVLTGTTSGPELPEAEFREWAFKRNAVNRYFESLGYVNINVNQKTHCEDAWGVEQQFRKYRGENRLMLTTEATARILADLVLGKFNDSRRTERMLDLMKRDPIGEIKNSDDQSHGFTGIALRKRNLLGVRLYSKAGWTSTSRHDAAYIETPEGLRLVIVIFTERFARERDIIPSIAGKVMDALQ